MKILNEIIKVYSIFYKTKYQKRLCQNALRQFHVSSSNYGYNFEINGVSLTKYVDKLEEEYHSLKKNVNTQRFTEIEPAIFILQERKKVISAIENLNELFNETDKEMKQMATEEKKMFIEKLNLIDKQLEEALLSIGDDKECNSIVLEINAGVGGQEAMLFANELFNMYSGFIEYKGWNYEIADYCTTDIGGIRYGSLLVDGKDVFKYFQYEAGVHRVQRIPSTEKAGRIHTSTASVVALPQPEDIQIVISAKDLKVETKKASGAGGQHVNTTDSAVRIIHLPTGLAVECQVDRSQIKNRQIALQRLKAQLYDLQLQKQQNEIEKTKKTQVKSNFRNEKIRTYNFSQDRITDHRLQSANVHNLKYFMEGNEMLESLIDKLHYKYRFDRLLTIVK